MVCYCDIFFSILSKLWPVCANFVSVFQKAPRGNKQCLLNRGLYRHNDATLVHVTKLDIQIHNIICLYYIF